MAMIRLKSIFPNTPLAKHSSMDIVLSPPQQGSERKLIVWDLGRVESTWFATEFFKAYFEGKGISPRVSSHFDFYLYMSNELQMKQDSIQTMERMFKKQ
jgi:hypothetical protein